MRARLAIVVGVLLLFATNASAQVATGTYVGDGVAGRQVFVGFQPNVVIVRVDYTEATFPPECGGVGLSGNDCSAAVIRTSTMPGATSKQMRGTIAPIANMITSLDATGFTVGNDERVNGRPALCGGADCTYYWVALKAGPNVKVGTYTGNGVCGNPDTKAITGVGFQPEYVVSMPRDTNWMLWRSNQDVNTYQFNAGASLLGLVSLDADGFTVSAVDGGSHCMNGTGITYDYLALNEAPGQIKVSSYPGTGAGQSITGLGFAPRYVITKTMTPATNDPMHRSDAMPGNVSLNFRNASVTNGITALLADGFQLGTNSQVNASGTTYAYLALGPLSGCCALTTGEGAGTVTVTGPASFKMVFTTAAGGSMEQFYDLAEDPGATLDLAGAVASSVVPRGLHNAGIRAGAVNYNTGVNDTGSKLDLLEATTTRVRLRQESFYQNNPGGPILAGVKGYGDYTIHPSGRTAYSWNRRTTNLAGVPYNAEYHETMMHMLAGPSPLNFWTAYFDLAGTGVGTGNDKFSLAQNETAGTPGARTDFLDILYRDWSTANSYLASATLTDRTPQLITERLNAYWYSGTGGTLPAAPTAGSSEVWNFLTYFKPTSFLNNADPAVTSRSNDYRSPSAITLLKGQRWLDGTQNTGGGSDDFNEAEAAYALAMDPAPGQGLQFRIDGTSTRYSPFFKIRKWRSFAENPTVTLDGAPLTRDVDYKSDVKPLARAHWASTLAWHCTMEGTSACDAGNLDVGAGTGGSTAGTSVAAGKYGNGLLFMNDTDEVVGATTDYVPSIGAIEFWYQPRSPSNDGARHLLWYWQSGTNPYNCVTVEKTAGDLLLFSAIVGATNQVCTIGGTTYSASVSVAAGAFAWRPFDWVHLKTSWNSAGGPVRKLRIAVNGVEAATSGTFVSPGGIGTPSFGGCSGINCPGNVPGNANGILDEVSIYGGLELGGYDTNTPLAHAGLTSDAGEYLADTAKNWTLGLTPVQAFGKGSYFYFGSDSPFLGLNVILQQPGVWQTTPGDLVWDYWDGTKWRSLESGFNFTDTTSQLTRNGVLYWDDPFNWSPYSVNGGPDLYYVRVHLAAGVLTYSTPPMERRITTDILLFQYCGTITGPARELYFSVPVPTAVTLSSFTASPAEQAVDLSWTTASELQNLGFHLYRSDSAEGPFARITSSLIAGLGSTPTGQSYSYRDGGLVDGRTYYYLLEDIETNGQTERHGPVWAAPGSGGGPCCAGPLPVSPGPQPAPSPSGTSYGDPASLELREVERTADHVVLELRTGGFVATPGTSGHVELRVPGFESVSGSGEPSLPTRRAWVEAVSGRKVRLAWVESREVVEYPGLRPESEAERAIEVSEEGTVGAGKKTRGEGPSYGRAYPAEWARVEGTAFQGERKKAQVLLFPLRWTGSGVELARRLRVRLDFLGREERETMGEGSSGRRWTDGRDQSERDVVAQLAVKERGLYRVGYEDVYPAGVRSRRVRVSSLRLSRQGKSVAFHVEPEGDAFGPGSSLYFLSEGSSLNEYGEAVYELETHGGGRQMVVSEMASPGGDVRHYRQEERREENHYYQAGLLEARDQWLWDVVVSPGSKTYGFEVRDLWRAGGGRVRVELQGASDFEGVPDHHVRVSVNGAGVGETTWDGAVGRAEEFEIPGGALREGSNSLELENVGDAGAAYSMVFLNRFSVTYPRRLSSQGGTLEGRFEETGRAEIEGASASSVVLDTTEEPEWLSKAMVTARGLQIAVEEGRSYLVTSNVLHPTVKRRGTSGLRSATNSADYMVIAPQAFLAAAAPLLSLRESEGLRTKAVSVEEVYEEFGHGEEGPGGIKAFLEHAYHSWTRPSPRYVLLLGDASYDPKDYLGTGVKDWIPGYPVKTSYLWTVSDPTYASVNGEDLLPDIAIGRLPAGSVDEALRLVQKIISYENGGGRLDGTAVLVADNADLAGSFEADADELASGILASRDPRKIYYSVAGASTRAQIHEAFDEGPSLMSYVGHGGTAVWASENIFANADVGGLQRQAQQPFLLTMNCLNGFFSFPPMNSLSEELLKAEGKGVVGAFSPTGLSVNDAAHVYHKALLTEIVSGQHERLGDAILAAQEQYAQSGAFPELLSTYHLLGDPALRIR